MFWIHQPCGTALLLFPAPVGFVVQANWAWNKVSAVVQPQHWLVGHKERRGRMVLTAAIWLITTIVSQAGLLSYPDKRFLVMTGFTACPLFFLTSKDNSACELISFSEVKHIIIFHLHGAKKLAFKRGKTDIMGLNLHALALRCALGMNGETEKALASLVLNVFPRKTTKDSGSSVRQVLWTSWFHTCS